jgi:hypothetical protein
MPISSVRRRTKSPRRVIGPAYMCRLSAPLPATRAGEAQRAIARTTCSSATGNASVANGRAFRAHCQSRTNALVILRVSALAGLQLL